MHHKLPCNDFYTTVIFESGDKYSSTVRALKMPVTRKSHACAKSNILKWQYEIRLNWSYVFGPIYTYIYIYMNQIKWQERSFHSSEDLIFLEGDSFEDGFTASLSYLSRSSYRIIEELEYLKHRQPRSHQMRPIVARVNVCDIPENIWGCCLILF